MHVSTPHARRRETRHEQTDLAQRPAAKPRLVARKPRAESRCRSMVERVILVRSGVEQMLGKQGRQ